VHVTSMGETRVSVRKLNRRYESILSWVLKGVVALPVMHKEMCYVTVSVPLTHLHEASFYMWASQ
jgi:hypothetical protein